MKTVVPKGAYHRHCRNYHNSKSLQHTSQLRSTKSPLMQTDIIGIQKFQDFQTYLVHLQNRNSHRQLGNTIGGSSSAREVKTSRPYTHQMDRNLQKYKASEQPIKPFFPFFKCKIESCTLPSKDGSFRISSRKFKLNFRKIEENMGKGQEKSYL